jgi:hypothetical protein
MAKSAFKILISDYTCFTCLLIFLNILLHDLKPNFAIQKNNKIQKETIICHQCHIKANQAKYTKLCVMLKKVTTK